MTGYALKTWKRAAFPALLFWVLAVCLLARSLQTGWALHREKSQPYRLTVTAQSALDPEALAQLAGVEACTAVYELSGTVSAGGYTADFTIHGVDGGFVTGTLTQGVLFPETSAIPYLVLNEAALKSFSADGTPIESVSSVDWLSCDAALDGLPVRLCGILKDGSEAPAAYMSQASAQALLLQAAGSTETSTGWVSLRNFGCLDQAAKALAAAGCTWEAANSDAAGAWPAQQMKTGLLALAGGISALAAAALMGASLRYDRLKNAEEYRRLMEITENRHILARINLVRCAALLFLGALLGGAILLALHLVSK